MADPIPPFPLDDVVHAARTAAASAPRPTPTGINRDAYISMINGTVQFFLQYQNLTEGTPNYGKIIDPYDGHEIQYSTPCFAFAGAIILQHTPTPSLYKAVTLAMDAALNALVFGQPVGDEGCAQGHCNFYTMPLMFALDALVEVAPSSDIQRWRSLTQKIDPGRAYRGGGRGFTPGNWGVVALTGEYVRYSMGLGNNMSWIEDALAFQAGDNRWTENGEYEDRSGCNGLCNPMPYDHFPRKYMMVMLAAGYNGTNSSAYWEENRRAAWTSMLLQSAWGELPTGARSSQHQWNEAVSCVTYEFWARQYAQEGDLESAGMFKRAAGLSAQSLQRWKRPTGEWFVLKNRVDPEQRWGYEHYTYYSQYNLLPASMLATALRFADDSIVEGASFAETGGFVFQPDGFHKVIANAGGTYVEVEQYPDAPIHDTAGLLRLHLPRVDPLLSVTATAPAFPVGAATPNHEGAVGIGFQWQTSQGHLQRMANLTYGEFDTQVAVRTHSVDLVQFDVIYHPTADPDVANITESYSLFKNSTVRCELELCKQAGSTLRQVAITFPAMVSDGQANTTLDASTDALRLKWNDALIDGTYAATGTMIFQVVSSHDWDDSSAQVASRNGVMQPLSKLIDSDDSETCVTAAWSASLE